MSAVTLDLVAFGPHPDDVELFCGGLLAVSAAQGHRVGVVDLTRGESASVGTPEQRAREAEAAAAVLGLAARENLGLPDGGIDGAARPGPGSQLAAVVTCLRRLRPAIVVVPHTAARHPDHAAAGHLLRRAIFFANVRNAVVTPDLAPHRVRQTLVYPLRVEAAPDLVVDISAVVERKRAAIACYASQMTRSTGAPAADGGTLVSDPLTASFIDARDRMAGARIGVAHGEPYRLVGTIGLGDPVDHFRRNDFGPPHLLPADS